MKVSSQFQEANSAARLAMPQAEVYLLPDFLPPPEADILHHTLLQEAAWRQEKIKLFGKTVDQPRLTAWYADEGISYTYSGLTWAPLPWLPALTQLRVKLEQTTGATFNSVLLNLYRHGQDSMGWHADDEPELGRNPVIASISLGQERAFAFRNRQEKEHRARLLLPSGSLLLMAGETQHYWQHQLAKSAKPLQPRLNLTFRWVNAS